LTKYSYFEEAYRSRRKLPKEYVRLQGQSEVLSDDFLNEFGELVKSGKIGRSDNVRKLLKLYEKNDAPALSLVKSDGINKAWELHEIAHPEVTNPIYKTIDQAAIVLDKIDLNEFDMIRKDDARIDKLKKLRDKIDRILAYASAIQARGVH
jgi:hypothetical protein